MIWRLDCFKLAINQTNHDFVTICWHEVNVKLFWHWSQKTKNNPHPSTPHPPTHIRVKTHVVFEHETFKIVLKGWRCNVKWNDLNETCSASQIFLTLSWRTPLSYGTSPLGFYMITASIMKDLIHHWTSFKYFFFFLNHYSIILWK